VKNILSTVKISGETLVSGQSQVVKSPKCKKYIHYSENFQGNSVFFSGQAQVTQKSWTVTKFSMQCIFTWGRIRVIWASVVCNQDQRRDWL